MVELSNLRTMIIVKIYGGLGNQLFQWAFGVAMAQRRNCVVKFDISDFKTDKLRKFELDKIIKGIEIASDQEIKKARLEQNLISKVKRKSSSLFKPLEKRYLIFEVSFLFSEEILNSKNANFYDGYWQNENYFIDQRTTILNAIQLSDYGHANWISKIKASNATSIHVRRTDYVTDKAVNQSFGTCSIDYYKTAIETILETEPDSTFYVFSDDIEWCKETFDFVPNIHFVDNTSNAFTDFYLMQICQNNIIANSSFSWWAAWLNQNEFKKVIAPKTWFANSKFDSSQIVPSNWIRL